MDLFMKVETFFQERRKRKVRRLQTELAQARLDYSDAEEQYRKTREYQPICLGGAEDKDIGERQTYARVLHCRAVVRSLKRRLDGMKEPYEVLIT